MLKKSGTSAQYSALVPPLWWLIHLCPTTPTPAYFIHTEATAVRLESQSLVFHLTPVSHAGPVRVLANDVRYSSRLLRPYNPATGSFPFSGTQLLDAGDMTVNPFNID